MAKSIIQGEKVCFLTGSTIGLHKHHIFKGPMRDKAEEYGCWVWLRSDWHVGTKYCVHNDTELSHHLQRIAQVKFEEIHGHDKFMEVFRKDYL